MTGIPAAVTQAATAFGLDPGRLRSLGGASEASWDTGQHVLRVGHRAQLDRELLAMAAAAHVVPVPAVIDRADVAGAAAVLLERLPGRTAADTARAGLAQARAAGQACGSVHARLARVPAPAGLPAPGDAPAQAREDGRPRLLHLDLHPLNLLVSTTGALTGVLDWANAAAGPAVLDRARTWAILTLDPTARAWQASPVFQAFFAGWAEEAGLDEIPPAARAWACRFLLADLARRYSPAELDHVTRALEQAVAELSAGR